MIEYLKSDTGGEYYIAHAYVLVGFERGRGNTLAVCEDLPQAFVSAHRELALNSKLTEVTVRDEEVWCESDEQAKALRPEEIAKDSEVSAPIETVKQ